VSEWVSERASEPMTDYGGGSSGQGVMPTREHMTKAGDDILTV